MLRSRQISLFLAAAFSLIFVAACEPAEERPSILRVGILPDQSRIELLRRYTPLFNYLSRTTDLGFEIVIPKDYQALGTLFHDKHIDLAYFGGLTFVKSMRRDGAIAVTMRDVDANFSSYILVRSDDPSRSLADLQGKRFGFGSKLSTSGHLMPRHFLTARGMTPESTFTKVSFSGAHDKSAFWVRDGVVDAAAVNAQVVDAMFADGRLNRDKVRILWRTPVYPDYVWALRGTISRDIMIKLRDAFLALSTEDPEGRKILRLFGANRFIPATADTFDALTKAADTLGFLADDKS